MGQTGTILGNELLPRLNLVLDPLNLLMQFLQAGILGQSWNQLEGLSKPIKLFCQVVTLGLINVT